MSTEAPSDPVRSLAALNAYIRRTQAERLGPLAPGEPRDEDELANARRFRQSWEIGRSVDRVQEALARKPANAGPLNSHALLLRSLATLQQLSPEYLRSFIGYVETLQWLEKAGEKPLREAGKAAKTAGRKKRA